MYSQPTLPLLMAVTRKPDKKRLIFKGSLYSTILAVFVNVKGRGATSFLGAIFFAFFTLFDKKSQKKSSVPLWTFFQVCLGRGRIQGLGRLGRGGTIDISDLLLTFFIFTNFFCKVGVQKSNPGLEIWSSPFLSRWFYCWCTSRISGPWCRTMVLGEWGSSLLQSDGTSAWGGTFVCLQHSHISGEADTGTETHFHWNI